MSDFLLHILQGASVLCTQCKGIRLRQQESMEQLIVTALVRNSFLLAIPNVYLYFFFNKTN